MKKQSYITKTKSKTPTSKTGQIYQNLCIECNQEFSGYTVLQKICSDECLQARQRKFEIAYKEKQQEQKLLMLELENAEIKRQVTDINRQVFAKEVENENFYSSQKPQVVAYMDMVMPQYESNS